MNSTSGKTVHKNGKSAAERTLSVVSAEAALREKIKTGRAQIGVLGMGYVGLPLALGFGKAGFPVTGFDVDASKVRSLVSGHSYVGDISDSQLGSVISSKCFTATTDFKRLSAMDAVIICVPTPLNKTKDPDVTFIAKASEATAKTLHRNQLVILESTTYPGTTQELMLPMLEAGGLKVGKDFFLAFSPERTDPGNKHYTLTNTPKVVGGTTAACRDLAVCLYERVVKHVVPVSSTQAAEMVKLLENTFRAVNIGLVNEIAMICDRLELNVWEIIEAASTKPYGYMPFYPGPGLGGHCIPIDPHYLSWKMKMFNFSARFIELAGEINSHMPDFVLHKITSALNKRKKSVNDSNVLLLGIAYKPNVSDTRESPALDLFQLLREQGANVSFHDPWVKKVEIGGKVFEGKTYSAGLLKSMDAVVITTSHDAFDPDDIVKNSPLIIDARNLTRGIKTANIVRL